MVGSYKIIPNDLLVDLSFVPLKLAKKFLGNSWSFQPMELAKKFFLR